MSRNVRSVNGQQQPTNGVPLPETKRNIDRKQQEDNRENRKLLVNCVLVFCMASGILTTSVVIHLGIENYNRLQECRELRREIEILKWKLEARENFTKLREETEGKVGYRIFKDNTETDVLPNRTKSIPETATESTFKTKNGKQQSKHKLRPTVTTKQQKTYRKRILMSQPIKDGRGLIDDGKNALFPVQGGAAISNLNLLVRHSMARIRDIEDSQRKFEVSQDFLREQVNQRLAAIEIFLNKEEKQNNKKPTFLAYLSKDVTFHGSRDLQASTALIFNNLALNEGNGFESLFGHFACPRNGVYVFHLTLLVTSNVVKGSDDVDTTALQYSDSQNCVASIRKNGEIVLKARQNIPELSDDYKSDYIGYSSYDENNTATIATVLVIRLQVNDVIDVTVNTNPSCVVIGCPYLCSTFQGYFLHE